VILPLEDNQATTPFYGRAAELQSLVALTHKRTASLVVIKGRRRIGKSRLAEELGKHVPQYKSIHLQGLAPTQKITAAQEREDFAQQISRAANVAPPRADDWNTLLWALADISKTGHHLLILDEINWLGSRESTFLAQLKNAWDLHFSKNPNLILVLSGSLSSWIERNILHETGFLGRISLNLTLQELLLPNCNFFWGANRDRISAYEKFSILAVTGGVPRYLEEIDPNLPADLNLQNLCFRKEGLLFNEFDNLFHDLFSSRNTTYRQIVSALIGGPKQPEGLYEALGIKKSGTIIEYADDLVEAGLMSRDYTWELKTGKQGKLSQYRLSDNYARFYLKYIEPNRARIVRGLFRPPNIDSILGLQFENIVIRNRSLIFQKLQIAPNDVEYDNPFFQRKNLKQKGCQIDYLIQTSHDSLYVCEIKFQKDEIARGVIAEVEEKLLRMALPRHMSCRPVLIHVGPIAQSVKESGFFAAIIDFADFLKPLPETADQ
jgi:uncharacterized protein